MYEGYLEFGGVPLINAEATEAYVRHLAPGMGLRAAYGTDIVRVALENGVYRTPLLDDAPWVNRLDPATHGFLGLYPIAIEGLDGSTTTAAVTEYLTDGGSAGIQRDTSRSVKITGLLVATSVLSAQAGLSWLNAAVRTDDCTTCDSNSLRYFVAEPDVCEEGAFGAETGVHTESFGDTGTGVWRYRFQSEDVSPVMPMRVRWDAQWDEGSAFRYGAAPLDGITPLQVSPLTYPIRHNYVLNPTFRTSLAGWVSSGNGTAQWGDTLDSANPGYAQLIATQVESTFYGQGVYGAGTYGAPDNTGVSITSTTATMPAGNAVLSMLLRSASSATGTVSLSQGGTVFATVDLQAAPNWQRLSLAAVVPAAGPVSISYFTLDAIDVDSVLLEPGTAALDYFDGSSVEPGYVLTWDGATDISSSRRTWVGAAELTRPDAQFRPFIEIVSGQAKALQLSWGERAFLSMADQRLPYERHVFDVTTTQGPVVLQQLDLGSLGAYIQVELVLNAGNPAAYSLPATVDTTPLTSAPFTDPEPDLSSDDLSWISDPNSIVITRPVSAPTIVNPAIESITTWRRYYVPVPATAVADWDESIPTMAITSLANPITQVRVRFHPNPFAYPVLQVDPAAYCSEFIVSYLPALTRLEVDGVAERVIASRGDRAATPADHLLYGAAGAPISWPRLSCAIPYLMTIDVPSDSTIDAFSVDLQMRRKQ